MTIVVVGGGAIGLLVAGRLAGSAVPSALLARPSSVKALAEHPLTIVQSDERRAIPELKVAASRDELPAECRSPDLAILCVKGYDTPGAIDTLRDLNPRMILSLQNGIGNEELLAEAFGPARVIAGAITTSVDVTGPTEIVVTKVGGICLAAVERQTSLDPWAASFVRAGFKVERYGDYRALKWSKALLNMLGNALAAILAWPVDRIYADDRLVELDLRAAREALAVMQRMRIRPVNLPGYPAGTIALAAKIIPGPLLRLLMRRLVGGGRGGKEPSLLRDLRAGRKRSEGEFLYGSVAAAAHRAGVAAPVNAALWGILGGIARGEIAWDAYRGQPDALLAAAKG